MQICSILHFSWSILVKCCVHLAMSSRKTQMLLEKTGIHILFFSESSAGQVSLMAYLPGYNFGCPDKSAELYKRMVKKDIIKKTSLNFGFFIQQQHMNNVANSFKPLVVSLSVLQNVNHIICNNWSHFQRKVGGKFT